MKNDTAIITVKDLVEQGVTIPAMSPTTSFKFAVALNADCWVPAHNGTEEPFTSRSGKRLLYCYNPRLGRHAYLDLSSDIILTDDEAHAALQLS